MACCFKDRRRSHDWLCLNRERTKQLSEGLSKGLKGLWDETISRVEQVIDKGVDVLAKNSKRRAADKDEDDDDNHNSATTTGTSVDARERPSDAFRRSGLFFRPATMKTAVSHLTLLFLADGGQHRAPTHLPTSWEPHPKQQQPCAPIQELLLLPPPSPTEAVCRPRSVSLDTLWLEEDDDGEFTSIPLDDDDDWDDDQQERAIITVLDGSTPRHSNNLHSSNEQELLESWEDFFFPFGLPSPDESEGGEAPTGTVLREYQPKASGTITSIILDCAHAPVKKTSPQPSWDDTVLPLFEQGSPEIPSRTRFGGTKNLLLENTGNERPPQLPSRKRFGWANHHDPLDRTGCSVNDSSDSSFSSSSNSYSCECSDYSWKDDPTIVPFRSLPTLFPYHIPSGGSLPGRYHSDSSLSSGGSGGYHRECNNNSFGMKLHSA